MDAILKFSAKWK